MKSIKSLTILFSIVLSLVITNKAQSQCSLVINDPPTVCEGGTVDLTLPAVTEGSTEGLVFTYWADTTASTSLDNPQAIDTTGVFFIKADKGVDCSVILPVKVTVVEKPNLVITNPNAVCFPASVDITLPQITEGSDPGLELSYWQDASGTRPLFTANNIRFSGTYYIKAEAIGGCLNFLPVEVIISPIPNLIINDPPIVCSGDSVDLTIASITEGSSEGLVFTYWEDAPATIPIANPASVKEAGVYYIMGGNQYGCFNIKPVVVTFTEHDYNIQIALTTADTATSKNRIIWDPPTDQGVESISIFKLMSDFTTYERIGVVSDIESGFFIDNFSDPMMSAETYKISVGDTCGNESGLSEAHKTMYLMGSSVGNNFNLMWSAYEGANIGFYIIYRKGENEDFEAIGTVLGNVLVFSDENPPVRPLTYMVEAIPANPDLAMFNTSFSNTVVFESSSVRTSALDNNIKVYPNPFTDFIQIEIQQDMYIGSVLEIKNVLGEILHQHKISKNSERIDTSEFPKGTYFLGIKGDRRFRSLLVK